MVLRLHPGAAAGGQDDHGGGVRAHAISSWVGRLMLAPRVGVEPTSLVLIQSQAGPAGRPTGDGPAGAGAAGGVSLRRGGAGPYAGRPHGLGGHEPQQACGIRHRGRRRHRLRRHRGGRSGGLVDRGLSEPAGSAPERPARERVERRPGCKSPEYLAVLNGEGVTFPDGASVTGTMRVLRRGAYQHGGRVRGPSLFVDCLDAGRDRGLRHFLLGTTDPTLDALSAELRARFPGVADLGVLLPPFGPLDEEFVEDCRRRVAETRSDIVWVALGVPKQDLLAHELSRRLNMTCVGVGAAFDMLAGRVREAPRGCSASAWSGSSGWPSNRGGCGGVTCWATWPSSGSRGSTADPSGFLLPAIDSRSGGSGASMGG